MFLKRCVFGDRFHRIRVDGWPNRRKKTLFQTKTIRVDGALIDRGFGRFHKCNTWIHFQSERTKPWCTNKLMMEHEDLLRKDKSCDTLY